MQQEKKNFLREMGDEISREGFNRRMAGNFGPSFQDRLISSPRRIEQVLGGHTTKKTDEWKSSLKDISLNTGPKQISQFNSWHT